MKTKISWFHVVAVWAIALPSLGSAISTAELQERTDKEQAIAERKQDVYETLSSVADVQANRKEAEGDKVDIEQQINVIMRQKRDLRIKLTEERRRAITFQERYGIDPTDQDSLTAFYQQLHYDFGRVLKRFVRLSLQTEVPTTRFDSLLLDRFAGLTIGQKIERDLKFKALTKARLSLIAEVEEMRDFPTLFAGLQQEHQELLEQYHAAAGDYDQAVAEIQLSDSQLAEIKRIVAAVEGEVAAMQSQMQQYDDRIRQRAERDLVAKGLKPISELRQAGAPRFIWPVVGRITAGFYDNAYKRFFGVPHKAVDIAQSQGSPVVASAHGIVHKVQHGGATGFSYVLIGHRSGYASMYGHLVEINVQAGQDVRQGQTIGKSGGRPGTNGAGPMTTGPHLHFEVIKNGVHVNPLSVLP